MSDNTPRARYDPQGRRHTSRVSLDTNASGIAESTISLGLSRFPEPPSSIPSTPLLSNFDSPSTNRTFVQPSQPPIAPLRRVAPQERPSNPPTSYTRFANPKPSFQPLNRPPTQPGDPSQLPSNRVSPFDWHDGASSIDVDAAEDRLLPTSFITSLLQENKDLRKNNRTSYASDAFSGISEMTYPPLTNQSRTLPTQRLQDTRAPPSSFPQPVQSSNRMSGDSETLASFQGYPSIIGTASVSRGVRVPGISVVGVAPATLRSMSASSQISSTLDSDTLRSNDKSGYDYQKKLSTAYETGDEQSVEYKTFNPAYSPALPSTAGTQRRFLRDSSPKDIQSRNSVHSSKSVSPSFISRISSLRRVLPWRTPKPLPPVPTIPNISLAVENAHKKAEETTPLPDLVSRAGALHDLLDKGHHPHQSFTTYHELPDSSGMPLYENYEAEARKLGYPDSGSQAMTFHSAQLHTTTQPQNRVRVVARGMGLTRKKWMCMLFSIILILGLVAIGAGVGVTVGRKKQPQLNCPGNFTGAGCSLDATCVCTSTLRCNGLAQAIISLLPIVNQQFEANISTVSAYTDIWAMQGSPTTSNCASQALLVDIGSGIDQTTYSNRTKWAQAALLWNAVQTQDTISSQKMKKFVQSLPWETLNGADGPVTNTQGTFTTIISGYSYNFASQTVTQPPMSFVTLGQPTIAQISRVSTLAQSALDRMYTFAQASATQQSTALQKYWVSVLLQSPANLAVFKTALSVSPIMLPFNASSTSIRNLYTSFPSSPFPPPLSCYPGLSSAVLQQINSVETTVFGLQAAVSATQFNTACYRDRPIYGILDVLRLRLPFLDTRTGVVRQAALLTAAATPRVVLYNGELMSSMLNGTATRTTVTPSQLDSRQYGTMSLSDHVILQYLSSISDVSVATALVQFVLNTVTQVAVPPSSSSILLQSLQSLPVLEVALFGDVEPSDLTSTVAPFTNPSGSFFFGSDDAAAMRNWTINTLGGSVVWTENATSPRIVRDKSLGPTTITQTWNAISLAISSNVPGIGLPNITSTFQKTGDFSNT
ncbi:hypothetical protein GALMADRAFT_218172 [Galerina marginata CBS 339.88]|uniref:Uncharacterized protein n=1 Tax=Galerina marginata (strain CBS 339.88) TaxID=685588 RepID=A0A067TRZ5_GALM3|nr:hypothetical protein GALMADRAFT_218172 [Galerina marginata CBS 339.88]